MFSKMKNIDTSFRYMRSFSLFFLVACVVLCGYMMYSTQRTLTAARGKIYVLIHGKLVEALAMDRDIPVELRDHISTFHQLFFTLAPDDKAITAQINKALYLADNSARRMYQNMKEAGYYNSLIAGNISQNIAVDTIELDMARMPYRFRYTGTQLITRPTTLVTRSITTQGLIRTGLVQSANNNHGFLIEKWEILQNTDIKTETR